MPDKMAVSTEEAITIRAANHNDVPAISKLGTYVFSLTFGHSVQPDELQAYLDEAYSITAIAQDTSNPNKDTVVATNVRNEIVGFALLTRGTTEPCVSHLAKQIELQRLYVHPELHGRGVGRMLASCVEDLAVQQGFKYIWLGVWEENVKGQTVYRKLGYEFVGSHDFDIGGNRQTDHIMVKNLDLK